MLVLVPVPAGSREGPVRAAHACQAVIHHAHRGSLARCLRAPAVCACWRKALVLSSNNNNNNKNNNNNRTKWSPAPRVPAPRDQRTRIGLV